MATFRQDLLQLQLIHFFSSTLKLLSSTQVLWIQSTQEEQNTKPDLLFSSSKFWHFEHCHIWRALPSLYWKITFSSESKPFKKLTLSPSFNPSMMLHVVVSNRLGGSTRASLSASWAMLSLFEFKFFFDLFFFDPPGNPITSVIRCLFGFFSTFGKKWCFLDHLKVSRRSIKRSQSASSSHDSGSFSRCSNNSCNFSLALWTGLYEINKKYSNMNYKFWNKNNVGISLPPYEIASTGRESTIYFIFHKKKYSLPRVQCCIP